MIDPIPAFIISHGRPDKVLTYKTLRDHGFTGQIIIVIDDLDASADDYFSTFGRENIEVFDKRAVAATFDIGDNFDGHRSTSYARNAVFDIAEKRGFRYFVVLDDDYGSFRFRFNDSFEYIGWRRTRNLDSVFSAMTRFMDACPQIASVAMAQGGDFTGGAGSWLASSVKTKRKCMNSWICATDRRFQFISRMNEDVNTYCVHGSRGQVFLTLNQASLDQTETQRTDGGMTEAYKQYGTYVKSFYSVMYTPSFMKVKLTRGTTYKRLHHKTSWNNAVPKILREEHKRGV